MCSSDLSSRQVAPTDFFGRPRPGGAQVFPGFQPANKLLKYRNSIAGYADVEANFSKRFMLDGAVRYENYSDFGSTINGGCAFSTVTKLAQGRLQMALTLPAFIGGAKIYSMYFTTATPTVRTPDFDISEPLGWLIATALVVWVLWESRGLRRAFRSRRSLKRFLFARRYRLSTAAAVIGISNGFLYAIYGRWSYASGLLEQVAPVAGAATSSAQVKLYLFLAVLTGAFVSALRSGRFSLSLAPERWLPSLAGGFVMGFGAVMVPGGNAVLILQSMPQLSAHALPAFIAMMVGMAIAIRVQQAVTGKRMHVNCGGDYCRADRKSVV